MGFQRVADINSDAEWMSFFHKTGSPVLPAAGCWGDLSMAPGTPKYNAYVGNQLEFTPMIGAGNFGLYTGGNVSPKTKHLRELGIATANGTFAPATFLLCDYLGFYPLVDMDLTDPQILDNSVASLPRYTDGIGVQAMFVTTTPQLVTGVRCDISYTNEQGVSGRTTSMWTLIDNIGCIQCGSAASGAANTQTPFIPLANGDEGIRSIQSITNLSSAGGFCAIALVRPLARVLVRETNTVAEVNFLSGVPSMPRIYDGAYLNFVFQSGVVATSGVTRGLAVFNWG